MSDYPLPPINVFVTSPWIRQALDIRFDNPSALSNNSNFNIVGVNIYRSYDSEYGPYFKINNDLVTTGRYRDQLVNTFVADEDVTDKFTSFGDNPKLEYVCQVNNYPIISSSTIYTDDYTDNPLDIVLKIGGYEVVPLKVHGYTGEVYLDKTKWYDLDNKVWIDPILPEETSLIIHMGQNTYMNFNNFMGQTVTDRTRVTVSYHYRSNYVRNDIDRRIWYKVSTVAECEPGCFLETPLNHCKAETVREFDVKDNIWKEAIRRNRWLLYQAGIRCKLFIRPWCGKISDRCTCWEGKNYFQAKNDCNICYGTGWKQGYYGPFDIIVAPPDTAKNLELTELGLHLDWVIETWTSPSPMLAQHDLIIFPDNRRFACGPITMKTCRGMLLQQNFPISLLDENDIRYKVGEEVLLQQDHKFYKKPNVCESGKKHTITTRTIAGMNEFY